MYHQVHKKQFGGFELKCLELRRVKYVGHLKNVMPEPATMSYDKNMGTDYMLGTYKFYFMNTILGILDNVPTSYTLVMNCN